MKQFWPTSNSAENLNIINPYRDSVIAVSSYALLAGLVLLIANIMLYRALQPMTQETVRAPNAGQPASIDRIGETEKLLQQIDSINQVTGAHKQGIMVYLNAVSGCVDRASRVGSLDYSGAVDTMLVNLESMTNVSADTSLACLSRYGAVRMKSRAFVPDRNITITSFNFGKS